VGAYVIVGLGNPGRQFERTRHNAGFDVIELLAARHGIRLSRAMCRAKAGEGRIGAARAVLAQPQTYMNLSGESVKKLVEWYKTDLSRLIICYDDVDLPPGRLRVRAKGSAGTHNGMRSVIYMLGRDDFARVRVGIGPPPPESNIKDYVLCRYETPEARRMAFDSYTAAAELIEIIISDGVESAARRAGELP
jgi:PTH1 family peptidyl-tRNA hydrolase